MDKHFDIIACDLDQTLLNQHKQITPFTKTVLIELQKQGKTLILASGRFFHEMQPFIKQLQLQKHNGFVICSNGYEVYHMADGKHYTFDCMMQEEADLICRIASIFRLTSYLMMDETYYSYTTNLLLPSLHVAKLSLQLVRPFLPNESKHIAQRAKDMKVSTYDKQQIHAPLYKICFIGSKRQLRKFQNKIHNSFPNKYNFFRVKDNCIEIVRSSVSKANAVQYVCDELHSDMKHVIAFGDSGNDEPLLKAAGLGVAMKNGQANTKNIADAISEHTNTQDGVAKYLIKVMKNQ